MSASLHKIFLRPSARTPVREVEKATAVANQGMEGDHHSSENKRQVTILDLGAWQKACDQLGAEVDPALRRANLLVDGVDLNESRGRKLRVGSCLVEIHGETRPCELMDDLHAGLWEALRPDWRGGVFGVIMEGGEVKVGDAVGWVDG